MVVGTHDLVIGSAGIIGPCGLLHDLAGDSLKVHQVVAGSQRRHAFDALETAGLLGVDSLLLFLNSGHVDLAEVLRLVEELVQGIRRVDRVEFIGRIFTSILEDDLGAAGVFLKVLERVAAVGLV